MPNGAVADAFQRLALLYGPDAVTALAARRVAIFGLGGVGSFAAEALGRSAVGGLLLVDFDAVELSNTNRQLQAMPVRVGEPKAEVLAERLRAINPAADIRTQCRRYDPDTSAELLKSPWGGRFDFVVDCIDDLQAKAHLLATCLAQRLPVVTSMGAAGKRDPSRVRVTDLATTRVCPLARRLRKQLRVHHGLPAQGSLGIPAVFSDEPRQGPLSQAQPACATGAPRDSSEAPSPSCPAAHAVPGVSPHKGTAVFVTGAFGLACAAHVVNALVGTSAQGDSNG